MPSEGIDSLFSSEPATMVSPRGVVGPEAPTTASLLTTTSNGIDPLFDSSDEEIIREALYVAADTRLTDLCGLLGFKTSEAQAFRDRCQELHDTMQRVADGN